MAIAPSIRSVGAVASGIGAITPAAPADTAADDILILVVETANQDLPTDPPTDWEAVPNLPDGIGTAATAGATKLKVYWRRLTAAYIAVSIGDSGNHQVGRIMAIQDAIKTGNPFDVTANVQAGAATTELSFASVTTTVANTLVVLAAAFDRDVASTTNLPALTNANLTSITEHMDNLISGGVGGGIGAATGVKETAGSTGTTTGTITSSIFASWTGAILPIPDPVVKPWSQIIWV